jgi:hypothetical protein
MRVRMWQLVCAMFMAPALWADPVPSFTLRMAGGATVVVNQAVTITATITNTDPAPIVFDQMILEAMIVPRENVSGNGQLDDVSPLRFTMDGFKDQFAGLVLQPGQQFTFTFGVLNFDPNSTVSNVSYYYYLRIGQEFVLFDARAWKGDQVSFAPQENMRSQTPEPASVVLLSLALAGIMVTRKWQR